MICFGPIPSRRLGKSLGINNIPEQKICSYSCVYCQVGAKQKYSISREFFYQPKQILEGVENQLSKLAANDKPDFLTFVANGEPTLDENLGESIELLKQLKIPIAVITNGSLIANPDVRADLMLADWVSIKIDTASEAIWRKLNRPHPNLDFDKIIEGIRTFAKQFEGMLATETMLVDGINDIPYDLERTAHNVFMANPSKAYISIPTRPPAISIVRPSSAESINNAYQIFTRLGLNTELILGFEGTNTGFTGNATDDILNICAVHPLREDTMRELLANDKADYSVLEGLLNEQKIVELEYDSMKYYLRKR
ncbi:MAG: radical SAM protein [Tenuifilaceae bacterium]|jgi:wyosine [tRNA(Phe)-imidazoG37] synthetase (radical SAM superfamily)|nr:radical SAM protein [Tenuifilaceae bacterium]